MTPARPRVPGRTARPAAGYPATAGPAAPARPASTAGMAGPAGTPLPTSAGPAARPANFWAAAARAGPAARAALSVVTAV
ncbi:hypothetical protein [Mycobacterium decipiens]|uniref:hypothetical protein n=1 Tax=Mycobacterium decipiens TaxID=1430326 RepID=UPI001F626119